MEYCKSNETFSISKSQSNTLKGLALIFVVMSHIPRIYPELNLSMLNPLGYIGVGIFLCLSGYGLQKSYDKYGLDGFWKKRVRRIIPALIITTIVIVIIAAFNGITFKVYQIIASCLGLSNSVNSVTWYILMIWFCYIIFYVLKKGNVKNLIGGGILSILILLISIIFSSYSTNMWGLNAFSFSLGMILTGGELKISRKKYFYTLVFSAASFCILFYIYYFVFNNSDLVIARNPVKSAISLLFLIGILSFTQLVSLEQKIFTPLSKLGEISYECYLIHAPFIFTFSSFFNLAQKELMVDAFVIIVLVLAVLLNKLTNKIVN